MQLFSKHHSLNPLQLNKTASNIDHTFLYEMYRVLGTNVDYSLESNMESLFRNQMIQRFLSMQVSLSYAGEEKHRSLPAKIAWTILNLRFIALCFTFVFKKPIGPGPAPPGTENDPKQPGTFWLTTLITHLLIRIVDSIRSLSGICSWTMMLINFIVDDLLALIPLSERSTPLTLASLSAKSIPSASSHPTPIIV